MHGCCPTPSSLRMALQPNPGCTHVCQPADTRWQRNLPILRTCHAAKLARRGVPAQAIEAGRRARMRHAACQPRCCCCRAVERQLPFVGKLPVRQRLCLGQRDIRDLHSWATRNVRQRQAAGGLAAGADQRWVLQESSQVQRDEQPATLGSDTGESCTAAGFSSWQAAVWAQHVQ